MHHFYRIKLDRRATDDLKYTVTRLTVPYIKLKKVQKYNYVLNKV